jgi:uncharacterized membrane protein
VKVLPVLLVLRDEFIECAEVARLATSIRRFKSACFNARTNCPPQRGGGGGGGGGGGRGGGGGGGGGGRGGGRGLAVQEEEKEKAR